MFFSRARVLLTFRDVSLLRDRGLSCFSCVLTLLVSYANAVSPANDDVSTSPRTYLHTHLRMRSMYKVYQSMSMNLYEHQPNPPCTQQIHWLPTISEALLRRAGHSSLRFHRPFACCLGCCASKKCLFAFSWRDSTLSGILYYLGFPAIPANSGKISTRKTTTTELGKNSAPCW